MMYISDQYSDSSSKLFISIRKITRFGETLETKLVFRFFFKLSGVIAFLILSGRLFQRFGATKKKALSSNLSSFQEIG